MQDRARLSRSGVLYVALSLLAAAANVSAFYLPGVAPIDYALGEKMQVKVCLRKRFAANFCLVNGLRMSFSTNMTGISVIGRGVDLSQDAVAV